MPLTIRPATAQDQPTIRQIVREARINRMGLNWPNFVVAEEKGEIVGVSQIKTHGDGSRELASFAVVPARQGHGIGSALIEALLAREPALELYLTCQRQMQGYYERFGFQRLERRDYPPYFARFMPIVNFVGPFVSVQIVVMRRS